MDISIDKESVFGRVRMNASIVGRDYADASGNSLWDRLRIDERDKDLLEQFWDSSYSVVLKALGDFVESHSGTTLTLADSRRMNGSVVSDLPVLVEVILSNLMTSLWMGLKAPEYAPGYASSAESGLMDLMGKLRVKGEPVLTRYNN